MTLDVNSPEHDALMDEFERYLPTPGSSAALLMGCTCPVYDNAHGAGMGRDEHGRVVYVMSMDCPLHGGRGRVRT